VGKFQKGQSGNPGGRPTVLAKVRALARQRTEDALQVLVEIATNKDASPAARVVAAVAVLDRGWGKPVQQTELGTPGGRELRVVYCDPTCSQPVDA
jgi:Family of unknown function (DUF5681)